MLLRLAALQLEGRASLQVTVTSLLHCMKHWAPQRRRMKWNLWLAPNNVALRPPQLVASAIIIIL
jgi:hypothetical protein